MEKKIQYIQIPNNLICTKDISHFAIFLYVVLVINSFNKIVNIKISKLLELTGWKSNKTLKKYLTELKQLNYINYDFIDLPKNTNAEIKISKQSYGKDNYFVGIDRECLLKIMEITSEVLAKRDKKKKVVDLKEQAIRLFSYYCIKYNKDVGFAYVAYSIIKLDTGIRDANIKSINTILHKNKILEVTIGGRYILDDEDKKNIRERNHYIPLCKIKNKI